MKTLQAVPFAAFCTTLLIACASNLGTNADSPAQVTTENDLIYITDRTGKRWEVSHAAKNYGMRPERFQFGLGPNAIRPILSPQMISPGEPGYPVADATFLVLATRISQEARAYPISVMSQHEVADEKFGDAHVAVAY